jgi:hypothetical protein
MNLRKQLRLLRRVSVGSVRVVLGIGLMSSAVPALVYFGGKLLDGLPPESRKELAQELIDLMREIQRLQGGADTDCEDCGQNGHGYMLHTKVWEEALKPAEREGVHHGSKAHMMLCPACVSERLDRPLTPDDFDPKYPINWPIFCAFELVHDEPAFDSIRRLFADAKDKARREHEEHHDHA